MRLLALTLIALASVVGAQDAPPIAKYVPPTPHPAHAFVLDSAHILSAGTIAALQDSARALQTETGADVAWVTLPTLGGRPIEDAALYIGRTWRIGSPGKPGDPLRNRGLVVLYVPDRTKTAGPNFRVEVGNGLEGTITDSRSRTITAAMREDLRAKRYDSAYMAGWRVAARLVREDFAASRSAAPVASARPAAPARRASTAMTFLAVVVIASVAIGILALLAFAARHRSARRGANRPKASRKRQRAVARDLAALAAATSRERASPSSNDEDRNKRSGGKYGGGGGFSGGGSSDTI